MPPSPLKSFVRKFGKRPSATPDDRALGDRARDAGQWQEAASRYRQYLDENADDFAIWVQYGHSLKEGGNRKEALAAYLQALEMRPADADLLLNLGHFSKVSGDLDAAARYYRSSYAVDRNPWARYELEQRGVADIVAAVEHEVPTGRRQMRSLGTPLRRPSEIGSLDSIDGWTARGWAVDPEFPGEPARVGFFVDGRLVGQATASLFRADIEAEGFGHAIAGFDAEIDLDFSKSEYVFVNARLMSSGRELANSPFRATVPGHMRRWLSRKHRASGAEVELLRRHANEKIGNSLLSIVMPVYNTRPEWLREAIQSVVDQWCDRWELICVDDCSPDAETRDIVSRFSQVDDRIKLVALEKNGGIAVATNAGIAEARGDYIGFMDHDDYLEPDAVFRMLDAGRDTSAELLYSDEALTGESIHTINHIAARSAFSHDYYLSHPYFVHFVCARADVARRIGGYDEAMTISADVDFVLRMIEQASVVTHVPGILYRWRTHKTSTGHARKSEVTAATLGAINAHLQRFGYDARATPGLGFNNHRVDHADDHGKVLIVIPTKNRHDLVKMCVESVRATTRPDEIDLVIIDHDSDDPESLAYFESIRDFATIFPYHGPFNYAAMNNAAVEALLTDHPYVMFLNNDIEAIEPGWLEHMRGLVRRPDVGIVGATLLYPNRTIQHSGVVMGLGDLVDHAHKFRPFEVNGQRNSGYNLCLTTIREYSAITAACMIMRSEVFTGIGGFDRDFEIGYNDTDICLRTGLLGLKILNDPYAVLYHHESATRQHTKQMTHPEDAKRLAARWTEMLEYGDPFYNPLLTPQPAVDHNATELDHWHARPRARPVRPTILPFEQARPEQVGPGEPVYR